MHTRQINGIVPDEPELVRFPLTLPLHKYIQNTWEAQKVLSVILTRRFKLFSCMQYSTGLHHFAPVTLHEMQFPSIYLR